VQPQSTQSNTPSTVSDQGSAVDARATLDHLGIAVRDPEAVARLFETLLGAGPYRQETIEREGVRTHFIRAGTAKLELLEALGSESPIAKHLEKRGEGLHHLAFEVNNVHAELARLKAAGFTPLSDTPRPGADGKLIFFLHPKDTHGVLIEFCQAIPAPLTPAYIPFRSSRLAVYEAGDPTRSAVLLLHGAAGATSLEIAPLLRKLETDYYVVALDFTGNGASEDLPDAPLSMTLFAENAAAALDALGISRAHVFGFSMGGAVALLLAWSRPERVGRLALHATNIFWDTELVRSVIARLDLSRLEARYPDAVRSIKEAHGLDRWPQLQTRLAAMMETLPTGELRGIDLNRITHPVLLSTGDKDELFGLDHTLRLREMLPDSTLAVLPGARHSMEQADVEMLALLLKNHFGNSL
jgi:methylmalonyl-CoA epimerase